jgi:hypothetical protein
MACSVLTSIASEPGTCGASRLAMRASKLGGGVAVEGHHPDPIGGHFPAEEHAETSDQGRRLAAPGRGDDLGRPIRQRRGRPLLGIQRRE